MSPGIKNINSTPSNYNNGDEMADFIVDNMLNDFECNLMWTAFNNNILSSNLLGQLNLYHIDDLFNCIYGENNIQYYTYGITGNAYNSALLSDKINFIKSQINLGRPCLVSILNTNNKGHTVVVYDYDEDHLYANFGWRTNTSSTHAKLLNNRVGGHTFVDIRGVMSFEFINDYASSSSSNYYVSSGTNKGYYVNNGATLNMHKHNISSTQLNNSHNYYCSDCTYSFEVEHDVTSYNIYNNLSHMENCSLCGSSTHEHIFKYTQYTTNYHKKVCELCGSSFNERHEYITYRLEKDEVSTNFSMCKYCAKVSG